MNDIVTWAQAVNRLMAGVCSRVMWYKPDFDDVYFYVEDSEVWSAATNPKRRPPTRETPDIEFFKNATFRCM